MKKAGLQVPQWITIVLCLFFSIGLARSIFDHWKKWDIVRDRQIALQNVTREHEALTEKLKEATSPAFIEREARDKLGLVREGDTVVLMPNTEWQMTNEQKEENLSNWQRWWRLFF